MELNSSSAEYTTIDRFIHEKDTLIRMGKFLFKRIFSLTSSEQSFNQIYSDCDKNDLEYKDNIFPPNENSLIKGAVSGYLNSTKIGTNTKTTLTKWKKIKWMRSNEFQAIPSIFNKEVDPNDIKQGALKNSYLLSVLAALAEFPNRLKGLFLTTEVNQYGLYGIRLCVDGQWRDIVIDDYFPCDIKRGDSCFSSGSINTIWVQVIEKCYAKSYGSYAKIEDGNYEHAMRDFTGAPMVILDNSHDNLLQNLKEACEKQWIVTASAGDTDASKELLREVGLIPNHAYTVLQVHEVTLESDNLMTFNSLNTSGVQLEHYIKVRNPWNKNNWTGDFSENNIPKDCNNNNRISDGCFFMNIKDFKHYFSKIQICKVFDDYTYTSLKLEQKLDSYCLVKMKVYDQTLCSSFISLIHQDKKHFGLANETKYFISRIIICKLKEGTTEWNVEYILGKMGNEKELCEERHLEKGEYLLYIEIDWNRQNDIYKFNKTYPFVLSTYSNNKIELSILDILSYPKILEKIYISCAKLLDKAHRFINEGAPNCLKYTNVTTDGYAYIYFENNETDATLIEDVKYTKFEGLKLLPPFKGTSYFVRVEPQTSQIVLIKQTDITGFNLIYSYHSNFQFSYERLLQLTKTKGKQTYRKDTRLSIEVDIVVYTYKYSLGLCFLYENNTADRRLEETLKIKGSGVEIVDPSNLSNSTSSLYNYNILITLDPNESKMIELRALKNNWSVQSSVSYKIDSF